MPTDILLTAFGAVVAVLLVRGFLRRGVNLLDRQALAEGERVLGDVDVELSSMPRRRALVQSLAFLRGRVRITTERVLVAQPALFGGTLVVRWIVSREGAGESAFQDGFGTFVVDADKSGFAERSGRRELRIAARDDAPFLPAFVVLRGGDLDRIAEALGIANRPARLA